MDVQNLCLGCMQESASSEACPHCGWIAGQEPESPLYLPPGCILHDQFIVGRVLGHGGFGITYLAWDVNLERRVAIKEYLPNGIATRTSGSSTVSSYSGQRASYDLGLQKFLEEARVLARFQSHPGMVAVQYFFQANGTAYLVMEYLEGITFDTYLKDKGGKIPFSRAMDVLMPVMDALREVHKTGILHRDVSPDNIYITRTGPVKLLDFGAARYALGQHSQNFSIILKEGYAPEEQYRSKGHQGPWTDVYACAATLYRSITGIVPMPALDRTHLDELETPSAVGVEVPAEAQDALMKALAVDADARFQSMEDFQVAIGGLRRGRDSVEIPNLTVPLKKDSARENGRVVPIAAPQKRQDHAGSQPAWKPFMEKLTRNPRVSLIAVVAVVALILVTLAILHRTPTPSTEQQSASNTPANQNPSQSTPSSSNPPAPQNSANGPQSNQAPGNPNSAESNAASEREMLNQLGALQSSRQSQRANNSHQQQRLQPQSQQPLSAPPNAPPRPQYNQPPAPAQPSPNAAQSYNAIMAQVQTSMRENNPAMTMQLAQRAIQMDPSKPSAYDAIGFVDLYSYGNYDAARENYQKAIANGGFALFRVRHDTYDGTFSNSTTGFLKVSSTGVTYTGSNGDSFRVGASEIEDADMNKQAAQNFKRLFGRFTRGNSAQSNAPIVRGSFHIKGAGQNFNLVGTSANPEEEARLILGLLNR